ncbi:MAG: citrate lyase holo-[acyl-carrier protein] synthase [Clostridiales bacterium]|nr:citrate lyase holo-[acyl-carrier protein] synthase [Clostridiales bacterium]
MPQTEQVTLEQMLAARDNKAKRQSELVSQYGLPLVSLTVNVPGSRKKTPASKKAFQAGYQELLRRLSERGLVPVYNETHDNATGYEAYVVVNLSGSKLKELTVQIENTHPLGRLLDYDIIGRDGAAISRKSLGYSERRCFLCNEIAHACARNRTHSMAELYAKIDSMIALYAASGPQQST